MSDPSCSFPDCKNKRRTRGYCVGHYAQWRKGQELRPLNYQVRNKGKTCIGPECTNPATTRELCGTHINQLKRGIDLVPIGQLRPGPKMKYDGTVPCSFEGCTKRAVSNDLCSGHNAQVRRGTPLRPLGQRIPRPPVACKEDGCERRAEKRGMCSAHYRQFWRNRETKPIHKSPGRWVTPDGYVKLKAPGHPEATKNGWGYEHRMVMSDHLQRPLWPDENVHHKNGDRSDNRIENLELWSRAQPKGQRVEDKLAWAFELIDQYADHPFVQERLKGKKRRPRAA